jgi:aminoglycoside 2'-N-acetyltransferase I
MEVVCWPEAEVPPDLRLQVVALQEQGWASELTGPATPSGLALTHDPALRPLSMLLVDEGSVLASLDILSKDIAHRGQRYAASGLSTVVTGRAHRRKGYGRQLVEAARGAIAESGVDLGIFTCDRPLQAFYERAGWQMLAGTVLVGGTPEAPFPSDQFDKVTMACFFSGKARAAAETFVGCRIELYPGEIDKLW